MNTPYGVIEGLSLHDIMGNKNNSSFGKVTPGKKFTFPEDHYEHNDYKLEWWYVNGNLVNEENKLYPFHVSFFRIAFDSPRTDQNGKEILHQSFLCNVSITDVSNEVYYAGQRYAYHEQQQCGIEREPFHLWVNDWQLTALDNESLFPLRLNITDEKFTLTLDFSNDCDVLLHAEAGYDPKGIGSNYASYHYTYPRTKVLGQLKLNEQSHQVRGMALFDREWGSSLLNDNHQGWDWFSMHFTNGDILVYSSLRNRNGSSDHISRGYLLDRKNQTTHFGFKDVKLEIIDWWHSNNGRNYPIKWEMEVTSLNLSIAIKAIIPEQLFLLTTPYWEGGIVIEGDREGHGFLEMLGY